MTDKEKLQQLFDAALHDGSSQSKRPTRAFPVSKVAGATAPHLMMQLDFSAPESVLEGPVSTTVATSDPVAPTQNGRLDEVSTAELAKQLDVQLARAARRSRRKLVATVLVATVLVATVLVIFGLAGGGLSWFVSSSPRVSAVRSGLAEASPLSVSQGVTTRHQEAKRKSTERNSAEQDGDVTGAPFGR